MSIPYHNWYSLVKTHKEEASNLVSLRKINYTHIRTNQIAEVRLLCV